MSSLYFKILSNLKEIVEAYEDNFAKSDEPRIIQTHVDCTTMAPGEYCEMLDDRTWRIKKSRSKIPYTKEELPIAQAEINKILAILQ